jgi:1,5-anhydro-D-fructose reductase (1,5-anhydro-D-mannitol-forming)
MAERALAWGLIGASTIAREFMIPAIQAQPGGRVAAVMSRSPARGRQFAAENGIDTAYDDVEALLADPGVDAVYISTTNERHKAEVLQAARAGKHVLCEKPLALTVADAREMAAACRTAGVVMGTNHHLRNAATHRALRRLVGSGAIGTPLAARVFHAVYLPPHLQTWRINNPETGAGVILDITVHDADTLRFILNDEVETVTAMASQQGMAAGALEDAVMGVMQFHGGVQAQFHDAFTIRHAGTGLQVHGTEGSLFAEDVMTQRPIGRVSLRRADSVEAVPLDPPEDLYTRGVRCFTEAIHGRGEPSATAEDGIRSLAVGLAVLESTRTSRHVRVDYGEPA